MVHKQPITLLVLLTLQLGAGVGVVGPSSREKSVSWITVVLKVGRKTCYCAVAMETVNIRDTFNG